MGRGVIGTGHLVVAFAHDHPILYDHRPEGSSQTMVYSIGCQLSGTQHKPPLCFLLFLHFADLPVKIIN